MPQDRPLTAREEARLAQAQKEQESEDWHKAANLMGEAGRLITRYYPQFAEDVMKKARYCRQRGERTLTIDGAETGSS